LTLGLEIRDPVVNEDEMDEEAIDDDDDEG
jgi:hypothetical protein